MYVDGDKYSSERARKKHTELPHIMASILANIQEAPKRENLNEDAQLDIPPHDSHL